MDGCAQMRQATQTCAETALLPEPGACPYWTDFDKLHRIHNVINADLGRGSDQVARVQAGSSLSPFMISINAATTQIWDQTVFNVLACVPLRVAWQSS